VAVVEIVAVLLLAAAAAVYLLRPWWAWRPLLARRVVVNLKTGRAISGVLVRRAGDLLFIRDAVALEPGAEPAAADGEAVVARADIDFIQAL
jgi:hypothetical protein